MTKKDYALIANALAEAYALCNYPMGYDLKKGVTIARDMLCTALKANNDQFNEGTFITSITNKLLKKEERL
jgi:hypothetical protein